LIERLEQDIGVETIGKIRRRRLVQGEALGAIAAERKSGLHGPIGSAAGRGDAVVRRA
jgi:hypothetical protein